MKTEQEQLEDDLLADLASDGPDCSYPELTPKARAAWARQILEQRAARDAVAERRANGHWERVARELAEDEVRSGRIAPVTT